MTYWIQHSKSFHERHEQTARTNSTKKQHQETAEPNLDLLKLGMRGQRGGQNENFITCHHVRGQPRRGALCEHDSSSHSWHAILLVLGPDLDDYHTIFNMVDLCHGQSGRDLTVAVVTATRAATKACLA
jgi:hypothetical protein